MRVRCVENNLRTGPYQIYEGQLGWNSNKELPIQIGQDSTVYAISTIKKQLWFLVEIKGLPDPLYYPAHLFEIIDGRLSKYWITKELQDSYDDYRQVINFGFKELLEESSFYLELLVGNPRNNAIFKAYKAAMDYEFI